MSLWCCTSCVINKSVKNDCSNCESVQKMMDLMKCYKHKRDVKEFLISIDYECYKIHWDLFIENGYDRLDNIKYIEKKDLEWMNVKIKWRQRILKAAQKL